jgi:hypothetical protein
VIELHGGSEDTEGRNPAPASALRRSSTEFDEMRAGFDSIRRELRWPRDDSSAYPRPVHSRWKRPGTSVAIAAWLAVWAYLFAIWPSLTALFESLGAPPSGVERLLRLPRAAFVALGLATALGLTAKDRWLGARWALAVDAAASAPAVGVIAAVLHAFLAPVE